MTSCLVKNRHFTQNARAGILSAIAWFDSYNLSDEPKVSVGD
jgi:hypothetical protein